MAVFQTIEFALEFQSHCGAIKSGPIALDARANFSRFNPTVVRLKGAGIIRTPRAPCVSIPLWCD